MKNSLLIISLDFELMWGVRDKRTISNYGKNILGVRKVIPGLLQLFNKYQVQATFATVGFLFAKNKKELTSYIPASLPQYNSPLLSPYDYIATIGEDEASDPYHYGASLIEQIIESGQHEIATHTFSHFYCMEGASLQSFKSDLKAAQDIAYINNVTLNSIVFPRNQYTPQHIEICSHMGLIAYRGNETGNIYKPAANLEQKKLISRASRLLDTYVNISGHNTFNVEKISAIVNLPASKFLRPYSTSMKVLDALKLQRIKNSMTYAARNNEAYHLWWHPHNFGTHTLENLSFLEQVLKHYLLLQQKYGMQSVTMQQGASCMQ